MPQIDLEILSDFYLADGPERVGFVLDDGSIVEVENVSPDSLNSFDLCAEDLITFGDRAIASFHTHPGALNNLSVDDHLAFLAWPHLKHYIIGSNGLALYLISDGKVVRSDAA